MGQGLLGKMEKEVFGEQGAAWAGMVGVIATWQSAPCAGGGGQRALQGGKGQLLSWTQLGWPASLFLSYPFPHFTFGRFLSSA